MFHRLSFIREDARRAMTDEFFVGANLARARQAEIAFGSGLYEAVADMHGILPSVIALGLFRTLTQNGGASDCWSVRPPPTIIPIDPTTIVRHNLEQGRRSSTIGDIIEFGAYEAGHFIPMTRHVLDWRDTFAEMEIGNARRIVIMQGPPRWHSGLN